MSLHGVVRDACSIDQEERRRRAAAAVLGGVAVQHAVDALMEEGERERE
eukprot:COSAG01_NODE_61334_length_290_cov_0.774869_1_plen_48_part_10